MPRAELVFGGTVVAPVKSGVPPDFVRCRPLLVVGRIKSWRTFYNGSGRDTRNNRPEACATNLTLKPTLLFLRTARRVVRLTAAAARTRRNQFLFPARRHAGSPAGLRETISARRHPRRPPSPSRPPRAAIADVWTWNVAPGPPAPPGR